MIAWAVRLGVFLATRAHARGDKRFEHAKNNPGVFVVLWFLQGVWVFMTLLPTLLLNTYSTSVELGARDYGRSFTTSRADLGLIVVVLIGRTVPPFAVGWAVFGAAFLFEAVADQQKRTFSSIESNRGRFISTGLWSISRHPNVRTPPSCLAIHPLYQGSVYSCSTLERLSCGLDCFCLRRRCLSPGCISA